MPEIYATPEQVAGVCKPLENAVKSCVSDAVFKDKTDTQIMLLEALAGAEAGADGHITPASFGSVKEVVRARFANHFFNVGDQYVTQRNNVNLTWDVIGIDHDTPTDSQFTHSMTLQLHDCFPNNMQFDAPEAFYYAENGLEAGTYHFTVSGSDYQFTLTESVAAGGQLMLGFSSNIPSIVSVAQTKGSAVDADIGNLTVTTGSDGTSLGVLAESVSGNLNSIHRVRYGSNNYKESAIRQWLNSDKPAGQVWSPQTNFDRPPKWVTGEDNTAILDGFMYGMDADFLAAIGKTHIVVARNTVTDGGGYDEMDDYFFLPSRSEVYGGVEASGVNEGEPYPYYSHYSDLSAAGENADSNRIRHTNNETQLWWCRTPYCVDYYRVRNVDNTGNIFRASAYSSVGVTPACNII